MNPGSVFEGRYRGLRLNPYRPRLPALERYPDNASTPERPVRFIMMSTSAMAGLTFPHPSSMGRKVS